MRPTLLALSALLTLAPLAHASTLDDFVLTGDGHTFRFSLPTPTPQYVNRNGVSGFFTPSIPQATVDGVGGYTGGAFLHYTPSPFGSDGFSFTNSMLGSSFDYQFFIRPLIYYTDGNDPNNFNLVNVFYSLGTFNLTTSASDPASRLPFTLTITPEATTTPEPATLLLLATGSLGLLSRLRRSLP